MSIHITIEGVPIAQKRARATRKGAYISVYDPQKVEKQQVRWQVQSYYREEPLKCPVELEVSFFLPIPKRSSKVKTRLMSEQEIKHTVKPDVDNLEKFLLDCLNGILFDDDSQIFALRCEKLYSKEPRTVITAKPYHGIREDLQKEVKDTDENDS